MKLLSRYLARAIISASLLVLMVLVAMDIVFALLGELDSVGEGNYGIVDALWYVLLTMPRRIYSFFPTAVLLGSLLGLGALASNSELIVMRAAGISNRRILLAVVRVGFILALLTLLVGEWLAPPAEQIAQRTRAELIADRVSLQGATGLWIRDGSRYLNIAEVLPDLHLKGITLYEFEAQQLQRAMTADSARYHDGGWTLQQLAYSEFHSTGVTARQVAEEFRPRFVDPDLFKVLMVKPEAMSIVALYRYTQYLASNGLDYASYRMTLWRKVAIPLSTLVMLLLAVPFVFGSNRDLGSGKRIMIGSLIGVGYFLLDRLFTHVGLVYGLLPVISAFMPLLFFAALAGYFLRRIA